MRRASSCDPGQSISCENVSYACVLGSSAGYRLKVRSRPFKLYDFHVLPVNHTHAHLAYRLFIPRVRTFLPIDVYKYAHKKYRVERKKLTLRQNRYYKYVSILPIINAVYRSPVAWMRANEWQNCEKSIETIPSYVC